VAPGPAHDQIVGSIHLSQSGNKHCTLHHEKGLLNTFRPPRTHGYPQIVGVLVRVAVCHRQGQVT